MTLIKNAIQCKHCGAIIESTYRHDFVTHHCDGIEEGYGIAVDGGLDYRRRVGDRNDWMEASEWGEDNE